MPQNLKDPNYYDDLLSALHDMVKFAPNGVSARRIAALSNMPYSTLMNSLSPVESNAGCRLDAAVVESLAAACGGQKFMAMYWAIKAGGLFVEMPNEPGNAEEARLMAMKAMEEMGGLCRNFEAAIDERGPAGQDVSDDELKEFEAQAYRFMRAVKSMAVSCRMVLESRWVVR